MGIRFSCLLPPLNSFDHTHSQAVLILSYGSRLYFSKKDSTQNHHYTGGRHCDRSSGCTGRKGISDPRFSFTKDADEFIDDRGKPLQSLPHRF